MIEGLVSWLMYNALLLEKNALNATIEFFIADSIKIIALLFFMIWILGFFRSYVPPSKIREKLSAGKYGQGNLLASSFGALTPFCTCSSIPIFISFLRAGVPLGTALSFLITSPIVNEYLVVLMLAFFGWEITGLYVISGIILGTVFGMILGRMGLEKHIAKDFLADSTDEEKTYSFKNMKERIDFGLKEAKSITKSMWQWILIGVGFGAVIHNYIPNALIQEAVGQAGLLSVPIATILGVPLYGSCIAIVPIAIALFQKGLPLGTALAFMMAVSALSLPQAVILRRVMKLKLILIFFGVVTLGIIITGYVFNLLSFII